MVAGATRDRAVAVGVAVAGLTVAAAVVAHAERVLHSGVLGLALHTFGALAILTGLVIGWRRTAGRLGALTMLGGIAYYLGDLRLYDNAVLFAAGYCLAYLWTAVMAHIALTLPDGRLVGRGVRALATAGYVAAVGTQVGRYVAEAPRPPWWWNLTPGPNTVWARISSVAYIVVALAVMVVVGRRWATATRLRRRHAGAMWAAIGIVAVAGVGAALVGALGGPVWLRVGILAAALVVDLLLFPTVLVARRIQLEIAQGRVARTMLAATQGTTAAQPDVLQRALAEAVGDPTLTLVGPRSPTTRGPTPGRAVTPVVSHGAVVALAEHDEVLSGQPGIAHTAIAVAGLALENTHLHEAHQDQVNQLLQSRTRLSTAVFEERHRIQRDLHDGAQQQLWSILLLLDLARHQLAEEPAASGLATVDRAHLLLRDAISALRDLTQGVYPAELTAGGLAPALTSLAEAAPVPVQLDVTPRRWPPHVEITAYFVVAEALANAYRHAAASHVAITVRPEAQALVVQVGDDGCGGATARPGSGLSGLCDRVSAAGGTFGLTSPAGGGTVVCAVLRVDEPCG